MGGIAPRPIPEKVGNIEIVAEIARAKSGARRVRYICPKCKRASENMLTHIVTGKCTQCNSCAGKGRAKLGNMARNVKHGETNTRLYKCWTSMFTRCRVNYVGVAVCNNWKVYEEFAYWARENGYTDDLTLDRDDVLGDYEPDNCQWLTKGENSTKGNTVDRLRKLERNKL